MPGPHFVTHKPPELDFEIRALWRQAEKISKELGIPLPNQPPSPSPPPQPTPPVVQSGVVRLFWTTVSLSGDTTNIDRILFTVSDAYTMLDIYLYVLSHNVNTPSPFNAKISAIGVRDDYFGEPGSNPPIEIDPTFATWAYPGNGDLMPAVIISNNSAYTPIYLPPSSGHLIKVSVESGAVSPLNCYHAIVFGTYIVHPQPRFGAQCV